MNRGKIVAIASVCGLAGLLLGFGIGASGSGNKKATVAAIGTSTTLSSEQQAAATAQAAAVAQAAADKAAADKVAADNAAAAQAAADKAAADKAAAQAAADKAAAAKAAAAQAAAERAAAAPRTFSGTGSKVTDRFTLVRSGYKVAWSGDGTSNFILRIHGSSGSDHGLVNEILPNPSSGEAFFDSPGGEFYLEVEASRSSWTITLTRA